MKKKYVIMDFGSPVNKPCEPTCYSNGKEIFEIFQYGAWLLKGDKLVEVVEASNNLNYLMKKYNAILVKVEEK